MMLCLLVLNMAGTWHNRKLFWIMLAYSLASASHISLPRLRKDALQ
jgi:hypothetical protein